MAKPLYTLDTQLPNGNLLSNEVNIDLDVLGAAVMCWIARHIHIGDVIAVSYRCLRHVAMEFAEQLSKPGAL
jgi:hypothetical protein